MPSQRFPGTPSRPPQLWPWRQISIVELRQGLAVERERYGGDFFSAPLVAPHSQYFTFSTPYRPPAFQRLAFEAFRSFWRPKAPPNQRSHNHSSHRAHAQHGDPTTHYSMQQMNGNCVIDETAAMLLLGECYNQEER
jgi:hypothetical protein